MSSSLQNIPNGGHNAIYHNTAAPPGQSTGQNANSKYNRYPNQQLQHQLYDSKSTSNLNQSLSPLSLSSRDLGGSTTYIRAIGSSAGGNYTSSSTSSSASPPTTINNGNTSTREGIYQVKVFCHK